MTVTERSAPSVAAGTATPAIETARPHQGVPGRHPRRRRASTSPSSAARSSGCSARTAPARPPPPACSPRAWSPPPGTATSAASTWSRHPAEAKRLIGVVPQTNTLDRSLTVWENLYFHGRFFGMDAKHAKAEADAAARAVPPRRAGRRRRCMALSGGMAQRLMVARAVMHRPSVLFLDEPTAGLDPQSRIALWEILGELHVDGQTILLTTHYMEEADQLCDRVAIIDQGRIVALDTPGRPEALGRRRHHGARHRRRRPRRARPRCCAARDRRRHRGHRRRRRRPARRAGRAAACCPPSSRPPSATASPSPTSPSPRPRSRPCSSTSPGRTSANDHHHRIAHRRRRRCAARCARAARRAFGGAPAAATSPCCARTSRSSSRARSSSRCCWCSCSPTSSRRSARASAAAARPRPRSPACSSPAWSPRRSSSRASRPWRCRSCRSSATPARSRTACWPRCPSALVAFEKIVAGALQCLFAGLIVFPIATFVPATPVHLHVNWPVLLTLVPLACLMSGALGLMFGTVFDPRTVPMLFGVILIPITFLGCTYYSWQALEPIRWLQVAVLAQPARVPQRGLPRRALDARAAHDPVRGLRRVLIGVHRAVHLPRHPRLRQARDRLTSLSTLSGGPMPTVTIPAGTLHYRTPDPPTRPRRPSCSCTASSSTARSGTASPSGSPPPASARTSSTGRSAATARRWRPTPTSAPRGVARMINDVLDALGLDDVTLVGNDTGGAICQLLLADDPSRIGRVVLTNCDAFENFPPKVFVPLFLAAKRPVAHRAAPGADAAPRCAPLAARPTACCCAGRATPP